MNRTASALSGLVLLGIAVTGCTSAAAPDTGKMPDTGPVAPAEPTAAEPSPTESFAEAQLSSRGNLAKQIGELAGTSSLSSGVVTSRFAVTDVVLDPACTSGFDQAPVNGHFLGIHLNIETTSELAEESLPWLMFTTYDWQAYDAEGKRLNDPVGNSWSCFDTGQLIPSQIGPGESVSGWMVLDVAAPNGVVALTMAGSSSGWEWAY